ncbi:MAG: hypothetical protein DRP50_04790 [Thermotoga sp.]|nr:MAG: hypothetical protein DRP50_04790 [Thermotoga sp.]
MPKLIMALLGFVVGFSMLFPYINSFNVVSQFLEKNPNLVLPTQILCGVIIAGAFLSLIKIVGFIAGFLISGFLIKAIFDIVLQNNLASQQAIENLPVNPNTLGWLIFIGVGVIGGIIASRKTEFAIGLLSMILGAFLTAFYTLYGIEVLTKFGNLKAFMNGKSSNLSTISSTELAVFLGVAFVYFFLVYWLSHRKEKIKEEQT